MAEYEWVQDEDFPCRWTTPVGDGTIELEVFDDELAEWPPFATLKADLARIMDAFNDEKPGSVTPWYQRVLPVLQEIRDRG